MKINEAGQDNLKKQSYQIYYKERENSFIIVEAQEMIGEKELDFLVHGYSTLAEDIRTYEEGEKYIADYLYRKYTNFSIQRGYKRLSTKRLRTYE